MHSTPSAAYLFPQCVDSLELEGSERAARGRHCRNHCSISRNDPQISRQVCTNGHFEASALSHIVRLYLQRLNPASQPSACDAADERQSVIGKYNKQMVGKSAN
jgi:hypothetical protein